MSSSLAYGLGAGGTDRWDKEVNVDAIKKGAAPLLKKKTYTDPLKRLSWPKRGSRSRGNSIETPGDQATTSPSNAPQILQSNEVPEPAAIPPAVPEQTNNSTQTQMSYHSLDSTSPTSQVSAILSLSNTIFDATPDSTKYSSLSLWQSHLSTPNSIIFFATVPSPNTEADVEPIGFLYAFARKPSEYQDAVKKVLTQQGVQEVLHVWLAGVVQEYRSGGVFGNLIRYVEDHARARGIGKMSVATVPARFGRMLDVLKKQGWNVVEDKSVEADVEGKVLLLKDVDAGSEEKIGVAK